ncbi:hypothetical protein [Microlunatus kandeliicorticis]|uniref:hypothetical protein n=1 Tax=Microlunatus kandeliicorticis TaxID=1759536 RepID=UPI0015FE4B39|nr:hypothetical protein [Microlunatus kandeliicorticis]
MVLVWDWMGRDATGTPFRSFLPFPVTVALFLVGFGLNLAGLIINTRDPGSWASRRPAGDATVAIAGAWRRRLEQALRSHEPLPTPWLRVVDGVAEQRGRPVGHVLRSVGWPVVLTVNAAQLGDPSYVLVMMGVSVWCVVDGVRDAVRAHRVLRYLGWLRDHPVG